MDAMLSSASMAAKNAPLVPPSKSGNELAAHKAAVAFEGMFIGQMLAPMFDTVPTDGPFGGGEGESMFRSLMVDEFGKNIAARGGIGLSGAITKSLLSHQEVQQ